MNKDIIQIIIFLFLILCETILSQENHKIITYNGKEFITKVEEGGSLVAFITYTKNYGHRVYVYDKLGNELLKISKLEFPVQRAFITNDNNLIICFSCGEGSDDIVKSINIYSKKTNWQTNLNANDYSISPNKSKLLTRAQPLFKEGKFKIINLADGSADSVSLNFNYFLAEWFSNDKIVLVLNTRKIEIENPKFYLSKQDSLYEIYD